MESLDTLPILPVDVLTEIFSWNLPKYSLFRCLNTSTNQVKIWWDGWDSLIEQGWLVKITQRKIKWTLLGKLHSFCDLPALEFTNGSKEWYINDELHRENDLPAVDRPKRRSWYINGQCHRDGRLPASIHANGDKYWYENGVFVRFVSHRESVATID